MFVRDLNINPKIVDSDGTVVRQLSEKMQRIPVGGSYIQSIKCAHVRKILMSNLQKNPLALLSNKNEVKKSIDLNLSLSKESNYIPLTPIQNYYFSCFSANMKDDYCNQTMILKLSDFVDKDKLLYSIQQLVEEYEIFKLRYEKNGKVYLQRMIDSVPKSNEFIHIDNKSLPIKDLIAQQEKNVSPFAIPYSFIISKINNDVSLIIIIHHLLIDLLSWRFILEGLDRFYNDKPSTYELNSFLDWAKDINMISNFYHCNKNIFKYKDNYAHTIESKKNLCAPGYYHRSSIRKRVIRIDKNIIDTEFSNIDCGVSMADFLLARYSQALCRVYGLNQQLITMEGHGRSELISCIDPSLTVGWHTSIYPIEINYDSIVKKEDASEVKSIAKMAQVENLGVQYGITRFNNSAKHNVSILPAILFNYLGDIDQYFQPSIYRQGSFEYRYNLTEGTTPYCLELLSMIKDLKYSFEFSYNEEVIDDNTFDRFTKLFVDLLNSTT